MYTPPTTTPADRGIAPATAPEAYTIRPATSDDYAAIADLINSTNPNFPATADGIREGDARRPEYCQFARWVAEQAGTMIGLGLFVQHPDSYDPHTLHVNVRVHPDYEGRGIGRALYATVEQAALALGMTLFRTAMGEEHPRAVAFALKAGYEEYGRRIESELDLTTFDPTPFASLVPNLSAKGIELRTYTQLAGDPELDRLLYELQMTTEADVPIPFPFTPPPFAEYRDDVLNHPKIPHDGIIVAVSGRELVGMTMHHHVNPVHINVDYTGVRRDFRGKGIALALKVLGATYAQSCGAKTLFTTNDPDNPAILTVNQKLGFVPRPALLMMRKAVDR
jgi:mycothiol synthase